MEEVDLTVISSLKSLGVSVDGDVKNISQFDAALVYAGVAACLKRMTGIHCPARLPSSMSSRYKEASKLAEKLQEIGFATDDTADGSNAKVGLGYQTILYASASDIRRLFVFLFDKLPRDDDQTSGSDDDNHVSATTSSRLWRDMRNVTASSLRQKPLASGPQLDLFHTIDRSDFRRDPQYRRDVDIPFWKQVASDDAVIPTLLTSDYAHGVYDEAEGRSNMHRLSEHLFVGNLTHTLPKAVIEELQALQLKFPSSFSTSRHSVVSVDTDRSNNSSLSAKPILPPKPNRLKSSISGETINAGEKTGESSRTADDEQTVENRCVAVEAELTKLRETATALEESVEKLSESVESDKIAIDTLSRDSDDMESQLKQREKVFLICENHNEGLASLENSLAKQQSELAKLQNAWADVENQYVDQKHELQEQQRHRHDTFNSIRAKLRQCLEFHRAADEEAELKQHLLKRLRDELLRHQRSSGADNTKTTSRQFYTKRIADIINNTHKQRKEISRITGEIRAVHKDMNVLTGKRDRALLELDEIVFTRAKADQWAREVYRNIAVLHEMCEKMLSKIETRGTTQRDTENVAYQTERLAYKLETSSIEHLQQDLDQIRQENAKLEQVLRLSSKKS